MAKLFDFEAVLSQLPEILKYHPTTLILAVSSMIIALIIGMLLALIKTKNIPLLKQIAGVYISLIRGTPVIVQLYIAYFGIPMITKYIYQQNGWNYQSSTTSGFVYAIIALSINGSFGICQCRTDRGCKCDRNDIFPDVSQNHFSGNAKRGAPGTWKFLYWTDKGNVPCVCLCSR